MYTNDYWETISIFFTEHNLSTTDTKSYGEINKVINPFDLNITKNYPYVEEEKNECCFLEIKTDYESVLVVFKSKEDPEGFYILFEERGDGFGWYPDLFKEGVLNIDLINKDNQLVLMYGISIIILDINTFEVLKYTSSDSIKRYGIKLSYENDMYIVKDIEDNLTFFDKDLNEIKNY